MYLNPCSFCRGLLCMLWGRDVSRNKPITRPHVVRLSDCNPSTLCITPIQ